MGPRGLLRELDEGDPLLAGSIPHAAAPAQAAPQDDPAGRLGGAGADERDRGFRGLDAHAEHEVGALTDDALRGFGDGEVVHLGAPGRYAEGEQAAQGLDEGSNGEHEPSIL